MKRQQLTSALLALALVLPAWGFAQERGSWRATSSTARSVTGDVELSGEKITMNFMAFPMAQIRAMQPSELAATFGIDGTPSGRGNLYRIDIPASTKFLRKNTLCGDEDTEWLATYVSGHYLQLAFFSGAKMPVFTPEAIGNSTDLCGVYAYAR